MITRTSDQAQKHFDELLETVQREPVVITNDGQPAAIMISPRDMQELQSARDRKRQEIAADWETWRQLALKSMTLEAAVLTDEEVNRMVHELR